MPEPSLAGLATPASLSYASTLVDADHLLPTAAASRRDILSSLRAKTALSTQGPPI